MENQLTGKKAGEVMCNTLINAGKKDSDLYVLTSDSRGSGSLVPFATELPDQIIEVGIAEQDLVTISAGLAHEGNRPFAVSPAAFLTMRSIEQVKVDVSYSHVNVKLVGISGGNSYSDLGTSHHSLQDLAITRALPNLEVYMPSDRFQTEAIFNYLATSDEPAYIRIGKKVLPDIYDSVESSFTPGKGNVLRKGSKVALIGSGETANVVKQTGDLLAKDGIEVTVVDMPSIKPIDKKLITKLANDYDYIYTVEEHSVIGGLGSAVGEVIAPLGNVKLNIIGFPDEPAIAGKQDDVFKYYGIDAEDIADKVKKIWK